MITYVANTRPGQTVVKLSIVLEIICSIDASPRGICIVHTVYKTRKEFF